MRVSRLFLRFSACLFGSLLFSAMCSGVSVSAAPTGGEYMSASDVLQFYGSRISAQYYNGTDYTDFEFVYSSQSSIDSVYSSTSYPDSVYSGAPFLLYYADISNLPGYNTAVGHVTVEVTPQYSITNTFFIRTFIGLQDLGSNSTTYQSPSYDWVWSGDSVHFENSATDPSTSGGQAVFGDSGSSASHLWYTFVPVDLTSSSTTSGYSVRASFSGNDVRGTANVLGLAIGIPYVSAGASGSSGTLPPSSSSPDINVDVNVDMSETNDKLDEQTGLLQSIKQGIQGIFDTIKNALVSVFVPDDDFMDEFKTDMQDLLSEHLGGLYQAVSAIDDIFDQFGEARAKGSIHIDAVQVPLAGETLTLGNWDVPLKQDGLSLLYDGIAFIIDFLAVAAFLNMCRNKLEIFLNPDSEVIRD